MSGPVYRTVTDMVLFRWLGVALKASNGPVISGSATVSCSVTYVLFTAKSSSNVPPLLPPQKENGRSMRSHPPPPFPANHTRPHVALLTSGGMSDLQDPLTVSLRVALRVREWEAAGLAVGWGLTLCVEESVRINV